MSDSVSKNLGKVIPIDEEQIQQDLGEMVRRTVEETINKLLDAEADRDLGVVSSGTSIGL